MKFYEGHSIVSDTIKWLLLKFLSFKNITLINFIILMNADPKCKFRLPPGQKINSIK